jgi:hypothetical protein
MAEVCQILTAGNYNNLSEVDVGLVNELNTTISGIV